MGTSVCWHMPQACTLQVELGGIVGETPPTCWTERLAFREGSCLRSPLFPKTGGAWVHRGPWLKASAHSQSRHDSMCPKICQAES